MRKKDKNKRKNKSRNKAELSPVHGMWHHPATTVPQRGADPMTRTDADIYAEAARRRWPYVAHQRRLASLPPDPAPATPEPPVRPVAPAGEGAEP